MTSLKLKGAAASIADVSIDIAPSTPRVTLNEAGAGDAPVTSQALVLQQALEREFAEEPQARWPAPVRAAVIIGASAALWGGIVALVALF